MTICVKMDGLPFRTGELYCNYHGWTFDGAGKCTSIPEFQGRRGNETQVGT